MVDDGSTDDGRAVVESHPSPVPVRVLGQENRGRFEARRTGLEAANGEYVLLLDAGVTLEPDALRFVAERLDEGEDVWNGHAVLTGEGPYVRFWHVIDAPGLRRLLRRPAHDELRHRRVRPLPEGDDVLLRAARRSCSRRSRRSAPRTPTRATPTTTRRCCARWRRAGRSTSRPGSRASTAPRVALGPFVRHAFHRGTVFVDGHGRPESRFFPLVVAFFPVSAGAAACVVRRPLAAPALLLGLAARAGVAARRRPAADALSFAALAPVYALAHGAGMWRGARAGRRRSAPPVICVVYGTTGELIKLGPVLSRLHGSGVRYVNATTGQQVQQLPAAARACSACLNRTCGWPAAPAGAT